MRLSCESVLGRPNLKTFLSTRADPYGQAVLEVDDRRQLV